MDHMVSVRYVRPTYLFTTSLSDKLMVPDILVTVKVVVSVVV